MLPSQDLEPQFFEDEHGAHVGACHVASWHITAEDMVSKHAPIVPSD